MVCDALNNLINCIVLGPEFPLVSKINNFHIKDLIIKIEKDQNILATKKTLNKLIKTFNDYPKFRSVKISVDVDPYN